MVITNSIRKTASGKKRDDKCFKFDETDFLFDEKCTNLEVFERLVQVKLNEAISSYNVSILSYGVVESGKSQTIVGS